MARVASFAPERSEGANDATRVTNNLYMPDKSHVIIIIINTQGQIVQNYFIRKDCVIGNYFAGCHSIYSPYFAVWPAKRSVLERAVCHLAACSNNAYYSIRLPKKTKTKTKHTSSPSRLNSLLAALLRSKRVVQASNNCTIPQHI